MQNSNNTPNALTHNLTLKVIKLTIAAIIASVLFRPFFVTLPVIFTVLDLINLTLVTIFYIIVRLNIATKQEITLSLLLAIVLITPTFYLSGGVNSHVAFALPLYPIFAALIGGFRESLLVTAFLSISVIITTIFNGLIPDLTGEIHSNEKSIARGFWLTISIVFSGVFGLFFLKKYTEFTDQLKDENIHDPLTGLLNRRGLNRNFSLALETAEMSSTPLSLILIDIDLFKKVNDMYGHDIGDICLIEVGTVLSNNIRKTDTIARFGGEEFIILLPNTSQNEAAKIADNLRNIIAQDKFSDFCLPLTITLGLAERHKQNDNALNMIKRADKALYRGKDRGRNCVELSE
jgi:diguanylate cyclase (GGDEF)-like protein